MNSKVAKRLRKQAGKQTNTSNVLQYEYSKTLHKAHSQNPVFKLSKRQQRLHDNKLGKR